MADDEAEAQAFLSRLQRRRNEMTSIVRGRKRVHMFVHIQPPPVFALAKRELEDASGGSFVPLAQARLPSEAHDFSLEHTRPREMVAAHRTLASSGMSHGGQRRSAAASELPHFADIFNTARRVEDGFGRLSHSGGTSGPDTRMHADPYAHRIRKGAGKRAGLALSCDGWGTQSSTLR